MNPRLVPTVALVAITAVLVACVPATANVITVSWQGTAMYTYIQDGIDAASPGDTVEVAPGIYEGPWNRDLDFGGTPLTLIAPSGPTLTALNCESAGRAFFFHSGEDTTAIVSGFRITGALADSGGGAYCRNGSSPKFVDCDFAYNAATDRGGALCCDSSSPTIRGCSFIENVATGGTYPYGGAIACVSGSAPTVSDTDFDGNLSVRMGGAVYLNSSPATFVRCDFTNNNTGTYGYSGATAALASTNGASFTDCSFRGNGLLETAVGGLYASGSTVAVTDCDFIGNAAGQGAGIHFTSSSTGTVTGCTFADNSTYWGSAAAGIHFHMSSGPVVSNCTFVANADCHISLEDCSPTIEYCVLAFATQGGAIICETDGEPVVHHCFIYENAGGDSLCGTSYHDNMFDDPLFCDYPGGDYTLCADSPCLAGVTWPQPVGAHGQGCAACGSAVEQASWGIIKSRYR